MTQTAVSLLTPLPRGADTRERILDAAERLFSENGFRNTGLRQITAVAGVNLAAINYHFQSKDQLIAAVLHRLIEPINQRRLQILDALEAGAGERPVKLEALLRAFLLPIFEARDNHPRSAEVPKLYARLHSEPGDMVAKTFVPIVSPIMERFRPTFRRTLPGLSDSELGWCVHFMIGVAGHTVSSPHTLAALTQGDSSVEGWPEMLDRIITFCAAGMRAAARGKSTQGAD